MLRRKKLCVDLRWIDSSGVGTYIKGIMPGLLQDLGDIDIVGLGDLRRLKEFNWSDASNLTLVDCQAKRYSLGEQIVLPVVIPRGTDLFFSPYYTVPMLYRGPLAVTVHDMSHLVVPEHTGNKLKQVYARAMFRVVRQRSALVFTVSDFSRNEFLRLAGGDRAVDVTTIPLGVAPEWYAAKMAPPLRTRPYLVCVGNIKPYKNVRRLVEAYLRIKDRVPHDLVLVGQNEGLITGESEDFFTRVAEGGERIHMTGYVPDEDLMSLMAHADALVMPSLYEGFGLPPLEAMAAGVPTVVGRVASLPEVCGDAALYFDPLDVQDMAVKLEEIALNRGLRDSLARMGPRRARLFTWKACATATADRLRSKLEPLQVDYVARAGLAS